MATVLNKKLYFYSDCGDHNWELFPDPRTIREEHRRATTERELALLMKSDSLYGLWTSGASCTKRAGKPNTVGRCRARLCIVKGRKGVLNQVKYWIVMIEFKGSGTHISAFPNEETVFHSFQQALSFLKIWLEF